MSEQKDIQMGMGDGATRGGLKTRRLEACGTPHLSEGQWDRSVCSPGRLESGSPCSSVIRGSRQ